MSVLLLLLLPQKRLLINETQRGNSPCGLVSKQQQGYKQNQWETFCSVVRWPIASFHQRGILTWFWAQSWILETVPFCGNEQLIPQESLIWSQIGTKGIWLSAQANHCSTAQKLLDDITEMLDSKQLFFVIHSLNGKIFLRVIRIPKFLWSLIGFSTGSMSPCLDSF